MGFFKQGSGNQSKNSAPFENASTTSVNSNGGVDDKTIVINMSDGSITINGTVFDEKYFSKYDMMSVNDRAKVVRELLKAKNVNENSCGQWHSELIAAYTMLSAVATGEHAIRKLTDEEQNIYQMAAYKAVTAGAALTGYISLLHPVVSTFGATLATDEFLRLSIGWWFFDPSLNSIERGTLLLHEVMHTVLGHYEMKRLDPTLVNIAGDAIINQGIEKGDRSFIKLPYNSDGSDYAVFPRTIITTKYPKGMKENLSFEEYYAALDEEQKRKNNKNGNPNNGESKDSDGNEQSGQAGNNSQQNKNSQNSDSGSSSNGSESSANGNNEGSDGKDGSLPSNGMCRKMAPEEVSALSKANVEKAGDIDKEMARIEAVNRAMEQAKNDKNFSRSGSGFNEFILDALMPPKVKWTEVLKNVVTSHFNSIVEGHMDYSYRRPLRRNSTKFIRPSSVGYAPSFLIGCDCSGSMEEKDYKKALSEVEALSKLMHCNKLNFVTVDTEITSTQYVTSAKQIKLGYGGGTCMEPFYEHVNKLNKAAKPDVTMLFTDGCLGGHQEWDSLFNVMDKNMVNIILITDKDGYNDFSSMYDSNNPAYNVHIIPIV